MRRCICINREILACLRFLPEKTVISNCLLQPLMQNSSKDLLKPRNLACIQKRHNMSGDLATTLEVNISLQTPVEDYTKLIEQKVQSEEIQSDEVMNANFKEIATAARAVIWKLLFAQQPAAKEDQIKAADLLEKLKSDACFYSPWDYNIWIVGVRDEVLKREMHDFWRDMVKRELGPCWARDSDYFDNMEDPSVEAFYKHAGCVAPFSADAKTQASTQTGATSTTAANATALTSQSNVAVAASAATTDIEGDFEAKISLQTPVKDYETLIKTKVVVDQLVDDEILQRNYKKIAAAARETIWKLLFTETPAKEGNLEKAAGLLKKMKGDACFYAPWEYNEWIIGVRDELLKRKMLTFWRDVIVKEELGPCWARDSDYFDDMEDPSVEAFYKHADCIAPFSAEAKKQSVDTTVITPNITASTSQSNAPTAASAAATDVKSDFEAKITLQTPVKDYEELMKTKVVVDQLVDDKILQRNYKKISEAARETIWKLLFTETPATEEAQAKAAGLLEKMKGDACFYAPWEYNDWITSVRDELLKRKMLNFWRDVIVKNELGPCWARDSDYFDDLEDATVEEFYKQAGCVAPFSKEGKSVE